MCVDPPGERLRRIAVCRCGQYYPECDLEDAKLHITKYSSSHHKWVYVAEDVKDKLDHNN